MASKRVMHTFSQGSCTCVGYLSLQFYHCNSDVLLTRKGGGGGEGGGEGNCLFNTVRCNNAAPSTSVCPFLSSFQSLERESSVLCTFATHVMESRSSAPIVNPNKKLSKQREARHQPDIILHSEQEETNAF